MCTSTPLGKKSNAKDEALRRSRSGFTTKVHAPCDALGNPVRFVLMPGQRADVTQAKVLLEGIRAEAVLANKGYDADWLVEHVGASGAVAVIPPKRNRLVRREYD